MRTQAARAAAVRIRGDILLEGDSLSSAMPRGSTAIACPLPSLRR